MAKPTEKPNPGVAAAKKPPAEAEAPANVGKKRREGRFPIYFALGFSLMLVAAQFLGYFWTTDDSWMDVLFRYRGMEEGDSRIVVVQMDDDSLEEVGHFPWPRGNWAQLTYNLLRHDVKAIALDIMFPESSPLPKEDQKLIRAAEYAGERLVLSVSLNPKVANENVFVRPFPRLEKAAKSLGIVVQPFIDTDGSVRRTPLIVGRKPKSQVDTWIGDPEAVPSLGVRLLAVFSGVDYKKYLELGPYLRLNWRGETQKIVGYQIIDGEKQEITAPHYAFAHISAWKVVKDKLSDEEREQLKGSMVLVGSTAVGYYDHFPSPFSGLTPGVHVHANLIDNILNDRYLREASEILTLILIVVFAFVALRVMPLSPLYSAAVVMGILSAWAAFTYHMFLRYQCVNFSAPALALGGTYFVLIVHKVVLEQQQKREVRQMFGQYVSPEVVDILVKDPDKIRLGGQKRDMTMFFLDIAHFTTISEKMTPEALIKFLNTYLTALTDDILHNNGVVDKYIGDCIMAFWNAPLDEPDHRRKACLAAIDCVATIARLNVDYVDPTIPEKPAVRIGLNSGEVIVGNTGSARKLAYTVLGDEVNLASRLEGANKFFGSTLMVSEGTYNGARDAVVARRLGKVRVVGKDIPIAVYELLARKGQVPKEWETALPLYDDAVEKYLKRRFDQAKTGFQAMLKIIPNDKIAKLYLNTCEDYIVIPPPDNWDGVFNLTSK